MKPNYILKKDLPKCPSGRVFSPNVYGDEYYLSMTDNERIENKIHHYTFKADVVENNPDWFEVETESHLRVQFENAVKQKEDAEAKIKLLQQKFLYT